MPDIYECRDCGTQISKHARVCPHCGFEPRSSKAWLLWLLGGLIVVGVIGGASSQQAPTPPKTPEQIEAEHYEAAIGACEIWAGKNAPGVADTDLVGAPKGITESFRRPREKKDAPDWYRAGFTYRSAGIALLMHADCTVEIPKDGGNLLIVSAKAGPGAS